MAPSIKHLQRGNSVKSGGSASIPQHNPQQFYGWNWTETLVCDQARMPFDSCEEALEFDIKYILLTYAVGSIHQLAG